MERHNHPGLMLLAVFALAFSLPFAFAIPIGDDGEPKAANKTAAAASDVEYLSADFIDTDLGVTVLESYIKTSSPTDLLIQVSLECALWTEVISTTITDHDLYEPYSRAEARVEIWIEIDGMPLELGDHDGRVTFCDRVHEQEIFDMDDSTGNFTIRQYLETKTANAFNWFSIDLGSGLHHIAVKADIEADSTEGSFAEGAIGARTLIVEPTRFPTGIEF